MKIQGTFLALVILLLVSCQKNDLPGTEDLRVHATITNDVSGPGTAEPWAGKTVYVSENGSTTDYLFIATTDPNGFALFEGLIKDKEYTLFGSETTGSLEYFDDERAGGGDGQAELNLRPGQSGQNGFVVTCIDEDDNPVQGIQVCVFTNPDMAALGNCALALLNANTDEYGRAYKVNVAEATYFARLRTMDQQIDTSFTIDVNADGFKRTVVPLVLATPSGLKLLCTDAQGAGIPGIRICGFASEVLADTGNCTYANFQGSSQPDGWFTAINLAPQAYHVLFKNLVFGVDTIVLFNVSPQQVTMDTVVVLPD